MEVFDKHAPLKQKVKRATEVPYMTKALRKAIANRSRLENRYYRLKTDESKKTYKNKRTIAANYIKKRGRNFTKT